MVNRLRFSLVEKSQLGSVTEDGVVCLWSVESQRMLMKFSASHTSVFACVLTFPTLFPLISITTLPLSDEATDVCFSPSNNMLMMSVGMDAKIKCYDIQSRKYVDTHTPFTYTFLSIITVSAPLG